MRWLPISRPPCALHCVYCGTSAHFRHAKSFEHQGETLSLFECSSCASLIYELEDAEAPVAPPIDVIDADAWRNARYIVEVGFSSLHVALSTLAALPRVADDELRDHLFVDVGAGLGFASLLVKSIYAMPAVTVEPSFVGKIAQDMLGLEVHRHRFEHLPEPVLERLAAKPCGLHLNATVERLVDPYNVLSDMVGRVRVEVLTMIVPDGPAVELEGSFFSALPFLAPRDNRHLPSRRGMEALARRLGFAHVHVHQADGFLTAVAARSPVSFPDRRTARLAERLFLEHLLRHPEPLVASGGASRLLPMAVMQGDAPLLALLRERLAFEREAEAMLAKIRGRAWDDLPFHLGPSCYWLAVDAMTAGRIHGALSLLEITVAFADILAADYAHLAFNALEFKWAALLLQAQMLEAQDDHVGAEAALRAILASRSDARTGARLAHLRQAEASLAAIAAKPRATARAGNLGALESKSNAVAMRQVEPGAAEAARPTVRVLEPIEAEVVSLERELASAEVACKNERRGRFFFRSRRQANRARSGP